jgi:hypothetical protein
VDTILISVFFWVFGQACFATARGIILEIVRKGKKNPEKYVELRTKRHTGTIAQKARLLTRRMGFRRAAAATLLAKQPSDSVMIEIQPTTGVFDWSLFG